jgi:hypothetical protein
LPLGAGTTTVTIPNGDAAGIGAEDEAGVEEGEGILVDPIEEDAYVTVEEDKVEGMGDKELGESLRICRRWTH